jgi:hypothetical protein
MEKGEDNDEQELQAEVLHGTSLGCPQAGIGSE